MSWRAIKTHKIGVLLEDNQMNEMLAAIHPNGVEVDIGKRITRYNYSRRFHHERSSTLSVPSIDPARHLTVLKRDNKI
jgi:hypothetical protein